MFLKNGAGLMDVRSTQPFGCKGFKDVHYIHLMILIKKRSCLQKLELGLWIYGFFDLLDPIGQKHEGKGILRHLMSSLDSSYNFS